jgi:hypothetical protein
MHGTSVFPVQNIDGAHASRSKGESCKRVLQSDKLVSFWAVERFGVASGFGTVLGVVKLTLTLIRCLLSHPRKTMGVRTQSDRARVASGILMQQ